MDVDYLAQIIRKVDGANALGAGALAEAIIAEMWQPIETAPKAGTRVLIWSATDATAFACAFENGQWQHGVWRARASDTAVTHWMPLPSPPEQNAKGEK